jgi:hypothetical protein
MDGSGQFHALATLSKWEYAPSTPLDGRLDGPQSWFANYAEVKNLYLHKKLIPTFSHQVHSLVSIISELS